MKLQRTGLSATLAVLALAGASPGNTALAQETDAETRERVQTLEQTQVRTQVQTEVQNPEQLREQSREQARPRAPLAVTMRIIEDPEAIDAGAVTRRISLPPAAEARGPRDSAGPAETRERGNAAGRSEQAMERGREFGAEVSERAREMREQASENREDFGRARAEEMRPELPERPEPPRPPRP